MSKSVPNKICTYTNLTPEGAVERLETLYREAAAALESALDAYLETRTPPTAEERARFCYPLLRIVHKEAPEPPPTSRRAFAKLQRPGIYVTTITHPSYFRSYLLEQLGPLVEEFGAEIEVTSSRQEIPYPYVLERTEEVAKAGVRVSELALHFPTPNLAAVGDEIADGLAEVAPGEPFPWLSLMPPGSTTPCAASSTIREATGGTCSTGCS